MEQLQFKISSALKNIIGRDLITDDFIAVFELVKNSFDAHAKNVSLTFESDRIIIQDNGKGMSFIDIKEKWLFLAYSAKKTGEEDDSISDEYRDKIQAKRYYAGAKGIGRFSCDRLGGKLKLISKKKQAAHIEEIIVNWEDFETDIKKEFVDIKVGYQAVPNNSYPTLKNGTIVEISNLRSEWPRTKLLELKHSLEKLINPFTQKGDSNNFQINIICERELAEDNGSKGKVEDRKKVNGLVGNFIFETLNVKTTWISTKIGDGKIYTKLVDRGTEIYHISEINKEYPLIEDALYQLFFLNTSAKNNFTRLMGIVPKNFGSVFLFKNGFRVYPFGDPEDDSLGMDYRKQQGFARYLGTRDLLGRIEFYSDNDNQFKETSSRDGGLVETEGYKQLQDSFYEKCLRRLERYVVDVQWAYREDDTLRGDRLIEDTSIIEGSLTSRTRIVDILRKMADNKNINILFYNKSLINILNDKLDLITPDVFKDLAKLAEKTSDKSFKKEIAEAEERFHRIKQDKIDAERRAIEEEEKRIQAEEEKKLADEARRKSDEARQKAEEAQRKAEEAQHQADVARQKAENDAKEKELRRREEEIRRKEAEQRAKDEEEKRILEAQINERTIKEKQEEIVLKNENIRVKEYEIKEIKQELEQQISETLFAKADRGTEKDDLLSIQHHIFRHSAQHITTYVEQLVDSINKDLPKNELLKLASKISFENKKIITLSMFVTKAQFDTKVNKINADLIKFVNEYVLNVYQEYKHLLMNNQNLKITAGSHNNLSFVCSFRPIEIIIILDNLLNNSLKAQAKNVEIIWASVGTSEAELHIIDDGIGIRDNNKERIFDPRFTTTNGSGLGLYHTKEVIEKMGGSISVNNNLKKGVEFILKFKK